MAEQPKPVNATVSADLLGWRDKRGRFAKTDAAAVAALEQLARDGANVLKKAAIAASPTGNHPFGVPNGYVRFKDAWVVSIARGQRGATATLANKSDHAGVVMLDTRKHPVDPKNKQWLRFQGSDGQVHFSKGVTIPAHKGNPILQTVLGKQHPALQSELQKSAAAVSIDIRHDFE